MSLAPPQLPRTAISPKFENGDEFLHSLGDIPPSRIVFDPWPGTATEEDLLDFVERRDRLVELIDGTLVEKPVGADESYLAGVIIYGLNLVVFPQNLGKVFSPDSTLRMASGRVRLPDVCYVRTEDLPAGVLPRVPSLRLTIAVEIFSPSNTLREMEQKRKEYFASGTKLIWIVFPEQKRIDVYRQLSDKPDETLGFDQTLDAGNILPGFSLKLADLFRSS